MTRALLVIDVQNDFCPGGALPVRHGDTIIPVINALMPRFAHVILTQDWHPPGHASFASQHTGKKPFDRVETAYGTQTLWPDHCIQGRHGADFHPALNKQAAGLIIRKGRLADVDSYSAFVDNDKKTTTGLAGYLREKAVADLVIAGLATDYCVGWSALDGQRGGFSCQVVVDACRAIDVDDSLANMEAAMTAAGVKLVMSDAVAGE